MPVVTVRALLTAGLLLSVCNGIAGALPAGSNDPQANDLLVVHCLLPGQLRQLGQRTTYAAPRRPVRTTAADCRRRGGEYVIGTPGRQSPTSLWLPAARRGDREAQAALGELFELGVGVVRDYRAAAQWYAQAARQDHAGAMVSLGNLYERGLGVPEDAEQALYWYRRAAGTNAGVQLDATGMDTAGYQPALAGPSIAIVEPVSQQTRGLVKVDGAALASDTVIIGRVTAPAGLLRLTVGGQVTTWNDAGVFQAPLPATAGEVLITAIDQQGRRADLRFVQGSARTEAPRSAEPPAVDLGSYHALLIANSDYQQLPDLTTPPADVRALGSLLQGKYGFAVQVLENASRYEVLSSLNELRQRLTAEDNLLIYYAGHGELDSANARGHWLPVDAEPDSTANWISNVAVTDMLNIMTVRQLLLVADSCYSGTLTRSSITRLEPGLSEAERTTWLRTMLDKKARVVLTSGGLAPVMDEGGGNHSVFAQAFLAVLEANAGLMTGRDLYQAVAARVTHAASAYEFEQVPHYAPIARAGHESGDFLLMPR